jgi:acyl carrier protein
MQSEVLEALKAYIIHEVLDGRDIGLEATTPLLEWGIINSLEIVKVLNFIRNRFDVEVPAEKVVAEHFQDLDSLTNLVMEIAQESPASACLE